MILRRLLTLLKIYLSMDSSKAEVSREALPDQGFEYARHMIVKPSPKEYAKECEWHISRWNRH
jgi:hypothetical protein